MLRHLRRGRRCPAIPDPYREVVRQRTAVAAVAAGGALGATARFGVGHLIPWQPPDFPWATALVNVSGCLLIGAVLGWLLASSGQPAWLRPFVATGVLGGYTTFSAFAAESVVLVDSGAVWTAVVYVASSVVLGLLAVRVGARAVQRLRGA